MSATATESKKFSSISAPTAPFTLKGGKYALTVVNAGAGTVDIQVLGPDGATWLDVSSNITGNGIGTADLPPGQYRINPSGVASITAAITSVPT